MRKLKSKTSKKTKKVSPLNLYQTVLFGVGFYFICLLNGESITGTLAHAQNAGFQNNQSRPNASLPFRPIGSESMVDRYQPNRTTQQFAPTTRGFQQTAFQSNQSQPSGNVRQVAMQSGGFALPQGIAGGQPSTVPNQFSAPPLGMPPGLQSQVAPSQAAPIQLAPPPSPPSLQTPPNNFPQSNVPNTNAPSAGPQSFNNAQPRSLPNFQAAPLADYQPVAPPQITNGGFVTMSNSRLITPPSSYTALSPFGCGNGVAPASFNGAFTPTSAQIAVPAAVPATGFIPQAQTGLVAQPQAPTGFATSAPAGSLVSFGQETFPVQVGQGLWGQPVAYVPGQSFRNWLRYLSF